MRGIAGKKRLLTPDSGPAAGWQGRGGFAGRQENLEQINGQDQGFGVTDIL